MTMEIAPVVLERRKVRLDPMRADHLDALVEAGRFDELWQWTVAKATDRGSMESYMNAALEDAAAGTSIPFVTVDKSSGRVIGSTRFGNIDRYNRRTEIGWTWITPEFQRTHVNSEAKYLMLTHAFEVWECVRVELKTDALNTKSRAAMLRIGCVEEGIMRRHMLSQGGRFRDSAYYSVIDSEWPEVRARLISFMERGA